MNTQMRTAVITGAAQGLGRVTAETLADAGFAVMLLDLQPLDAIVTELRAKGHTAHGLSGDIADEAFVQQAAAEVALTMGSAEVLVNNAGISQIIPAEQLTAAQWRRVMDVNLLGPFLLCREFGRQMLAKGRGSIINVASVASFTASPGNVNYCATKAYERVMCEALAMELEGTGVTVQALCPGFTHTEFHDRASIDKTVGIPAWAWMEADRVVRESLEAAHAGGPVVVIPGKRYQAIVLALRYMPQWVRRTLQQRYGKART